MFPSTSAYLLLLFLMTPISYAKSTYDFRYLLSNARQIICCCDQVVECRINDSAKKQKKNEMSRP